MSSIKETLKPAPIQETVSQETVSKESRDPNSRELKSLKDLEALDILSDNPELKRQSAERIARLMLEIDQKL
jgi:hypothetical protein